MVVSSVSIPEPLGGLKPCYKQTDWLVKCWLTAKYEKIICTYNVHHKEKKEGLIRNLATKLLLAKAKLINAYGRITNIFIYQQQQKNV